MQQAEVGQRQLPAYKSHKTVWALKIADIQQSPADELSTVDGGSWRLIPAYKGYGVITVPHSYVQKHQPHVGGYYVVYADGYQSFSPAKAFEEGYIPIDNYAPAIAMSQAETSGLVVSDAKSAADRGNPVPLETAIKGAGADRAPRITPADIEANIASVHYFRADEGIHGAENNPHEPTPGNGVVLGDYPFSLLTFCVLVLRNGFTVTGQSACASPENFNAEIGRRIAREDAVRQVWPLLGFRLRDKLAATPADFRDRVRAEKQDLDEKIARLSAFFVTKQFGALSFVEQANLHTQHVAMTTYSDILGQRIAAFGQGQPG